MEPAGSETFQLQPSIWKLIARFCPPEEQQEVQRILGYAIVEQARDLYCEASTHLEIWKQLKDESEESIVLQRLPEPPAVRERLVQEIRFLLEHLEHKEKQSLRNETGARKRQIEEYVRQQQAQHPQSQSRPSSAASYRSQSAMSMLSEIEGRCSALGGEAKTICEHVTVTEVDSVIHNLREALREECEIRTQEVQFLQRCVEEASEKMKWKSNEEPSIQELREFGTELEKEILEGINHMTTTSPVVDHHRTRTPLLPPLREDRVGGASDASKDQCLHGGQGGQRGQTNLPNSNNEKGPSNSPQDVFTMKPNPPCISVERTYLSLRADRCIDRRETVI